MIENLPSYISVIFILTTIATLLLFYEVINSSSIEKTRKKAAFFLVSFSIWLIIQAVLTLNNFYNSDPNLFPPKIVLFGILPLLLTVIWLFAATKGRQFIDSLPLGNIINLNIVRIPVEIVLFWLFLNKAVPELMTFEGRNFDIIAGVSAPFIAYFGFKRGMLSRKFSLVWNLICLGLLINIVGSAALSIPSPVQTVAFEQPNIAMLNFPFSWLPTFIVPIVLFGHLVAIRQLSRKSKD